MPKHLWEHDDSNRTSSVCISRDGNYAASLGSTGTLNFYYPHTLYPPVWTWTGAETTYGGAAMAMSDDGKKIAIAGSNDLYCFGVTNNTPLWTTNGGTYDNWFNSSNNVAISGDGNYVAAFSNLTNSGGTADKIILFDGDGNFKWTWSGRSSGQPLGSLNLSQDGKYLAAGFNNASNDNSNPQVVFWDTSSSTPLWTWTTSGTTNAKAVKTIAISRDGTYIAAPIKRTQQLPTLNSDTENSQLMFFSKDSGTPLWTSSIDAYGSRINCDISDDGRYVLLGTGEKGGAANYGDSNKLILYDTQSATPSTPIWKSSQYASDIIGVSIRGDADYFAASITDDGIDVYDFVDKSANPSVVFNNSTGGDWFGSDVDWVNQGRYGQSSSGDTQQVGPVKITKGGNNYKVIGAGGDSDKIHFYDYSYNHKGDSESSFSSAASSLSSDTNTLTLNNKQISGILKGGSYYLFGDHDQT